MLQIQEVHPGAHSNACNFCRIFIYFSYQSYLGHTSLQTKEQLFYILFKSHNQETSTSSVVNGLVHAIHKRSKKCLVQKVAHFGSLRLIFMIELPLDSSGVALLYEPETNCFFFI